MLQLARAMKQLASDFFLKKIYLARGIDRPGPLCVWGITQELFENKNKCTLEILLEWLPSGKQVMLLDQVAW